MIYDSLYQDAYLEVDEGGGEDLECRHAAAIGRLNQSLPEKKRRKSKNYYSSLTKDASTKFFMRKRGENQKITIFHY